MYLFKRDEQNRSNGNLANVNAGSSSFKYKSRILGSQAAVGNNGILRNAKIAVPLKSLSIFFRSLETSMINFKIHLELNWTKDCVMCTTAKATIKITNTKCSNRKTV